MGILLEDVSHLLSSDCGLALKDLLLGSFPKDFPLLETKDGARLARQIYFVAEHTTRRDVIYFHTRYSMLSGYS